MNIDFLRWIFSNDAFFLDYKLFLSSSFFFFHVFINFLPLLESFNDVTNQDNIEKIAKTAKKIFELMETKNYKVKQLFFSHFLNNFSLIL